LRRMGLGMAVLLVVLGAGGQNGGSSSTGALPAAGADPHGSS
jgi:hypothetical protein